LLSNKYVVIVTARERTQASAFITNANMSFGEVSGAKLTRAFPSETPGVPACLSRRTSKRNSKRSMIAFNMLCQDHIAKAARAVFYAEAPEVRQSDSRSIGIRVCACPYFCVLFRNRSS